MKICNFRNGKLEKGQIVKIDIPSGEVSGDDYKKEINDKKGELIGIYKANDFETFWRLELVNYDGISPDNCYVTGDGIIDVPSRHIKVVL